MPKALQLRHRLYNFCRICFVSRVGAMLESLFFTCDQLLRMTPRIHNTGSIFRVCTQRAWEPLVWSCARGIANVLVSEEWTVLTSLVLWFSFGPRSQSDSGFHCASVKVQEHIDMLAEPSDLGVDLFSFSALKGTILTPGAIATTS